MQKGFSPVVVVVLALVLITGVVAGYIILSKPKFPIYAPPLPVITSDQTSPESQASSPDETLSWKTFVYSSNNFSFKYPDNVSPHELKDQYTDVVLGFKYPGSPDGCELCDGYNLSFKLGSLNQQSLKQVTEKKLKEIESYGTITKPLAAVNIGNYSGFTFSYTVQVGTTNIYLLDGKGNYIEISKSLDDPQNRGYEKIIEQIISTFKFLE